MRLTRTVPPQKTPLTGYSGEGGYISVNVGKKTTGKFSNPSMIFQKAASKLEID